MSTSATSRTVIVSGVVLSALYVAPLPEPVGTIASLAVGVGAVGVQVAAIRDDGTGLRCAWVLSAVASASFLLGIVLRPMVSGHGGYSPLLADAFSTLGYLLMALSFTMMLRTTRLVPFALVDGLTVCIGAAAITSQFLVLPTMQISDRPALVSMVAASYPLWDVVILLVLLNLAFTSAIRLTGFRLIVAAVSAMFVGDLAYAVLGTQGRLTGSALLDLPFLLGFCLFAAAAAHPSRVQMPEIRARQVQSWSLPRLALMLPALLAPAATVFGGPPGLAGDVVPAVSSVVLISALLLRALSAVRSHVISQEGLRHQASHDDLTGLPNRVLLGEQVNELIRSEPRRGTGTWVLFLDLDGFKLINDHWGHETGDLLLVEVSQRLTRLASHCLVARTSGDEFAVAGTGGLPQAAAVADRILAELADVVELPGIELVVGASIGLVARTDQHTTDELLRDADLAMYRAKAEGRNRWRAFDTAMRQTVRERVEIEMALRHALARKELWVSYQPIVDCRSGRVTGAEALLRWTHPERGLISPVEFVPVAEETGLIEEIGAFVLLESLAQLARWRDRSLLDDDFRMSINVSGRQMRGDRLVSMVRDALAEHRLSPKNLSLEITESIMMDDASAMSEILTQLRGLGVGLSVDDFGTGYSSLSYLSRLPVTTVKIDRSFVTGLGSDAGADAIARAVVAMASALDLSVIAEGVETEAQRETLCALDVVHAQGWLWGAAERPDSFVERHLLPSTARSIARALATS